MRERWGADHQPKDSPVSRWEVGSQTRINGLFKAEVIWRSGLWRSLEAVEYATLEKVDWCNNRRLMEPTGNIPPTEAEVKYHPALKQTAIAA